MPNVVWQATEPACCGVPRGTCSVCEAFVHIYQNHDYCPECEAFWDGVVTGAGDWLDYDVILDSMGLSSANEFDDYGDDEADHLYGPPPTNVGLFNYSYQPRLQFRGTGDYYLGVELEIGTSTNNCQPIAEWAEANDAENLFFCKEDGSVAGFEIVTHPMTFDYFHAFDWESFFDMLNSEYPSPYGDTESSEHGIHVHVSRTAFPKASALARWCYLFNRNADPVQRIARRRGSGWARFSEYPVHDVMHTTKEWPVNNYDMYDARGHIREEYRSLRTAMQEWQVRMRNYPFPQRYQAINHTNPATCEVRVFRSTRVPETFRQAIGLVASTVEYARSLQPSHETPLRDALTWDAFTGFVESREEFASLAPAFKSAARRQGRN